MSTARTIASLAQTTTTVAEMVFPFGLGNCQKNAIENYGWNDDLFKTYKNQFNSCMAIYGILKGMLEIVEAIALISRNNHLRDAKDSNHSKIAYEVLQHDSIIALPQIITGAASMVAGLLYLLSGTSVVALGLVLASNALVRAVLIFFTQHTHVNQFKELKVRAEGEQDLSGFLDQFQLKDEAGSVISESFGMMDISRIVANVFEAIGFAEFSLNITENSIVDIYKSHTWLVWAGLFSSYALANKIYNKIYPPQMQNINMAVPAP